MDGERKSLKKLNKFKQKDYDGRLIFWGNALDMVGTLDNSYLLDIFNSLPHPWTKTEKRRSNGNSKGAFCTGRNKRGRI